MELRLFSFVSWIQRPPLEIKNAAYHLGVPNDAIHLNTLKTLLRLSTVLLDHWKWILSGAIKVRAT